MLHTKIESPDDRNALLIALLQHLENGNDVIRCAALRALQIHGEDTVKPALVSALLDEDPDVRADAIAALKRFATAEDAEAVRGSLAGDPVREVKIAAIEILAALDDAASTPLIRALASSRCADEVVWEDEDDVWDDWLDVQIAAIAALGQMQVADAIPELLALRDDEFGQELDVHIFNALAAIEGDGPLTLLELAAGEDERTRSRALRALAKADPQNLAALLPDLIADDSADVRALAVPLLGPTDNRLAYLALNDPDASLRRAALERCAPEREEIAVAALSDDDEAVRSTALDHLGTEFEPEFADALSANIQAWMTVAGAPLAAACVRNAARLCGEAAFAALVGLAEDETRPLEVRIEAVQAIAQSDNQERVDTLTGLLSDAARQIRTAALTGLRDIAEEEGDPALAEDAIAVLAETISGAFGNTALEGDKSHDTGSMDDGGHEPARRQRVRISETGEVVEEEAGKEPFPSSTLGNIDLRLADTGHKDEKSEQGPRRGRRRVAIEGPENFKADLRCTALRICASVDAEPVLEAILVATDDDDATVREAAFGALAQRAANMMLPESAIELLTETLGDKNDRIRGHAALALCRGSAKPLPQLKSMLDDCDAVVRACAVRVSEPEIAADYFADIAGGVREAAIEVAAQTSDPQVVARGLETACAAGYSDTLANACRQSPVAKRILAEQLCDAETPPKAVLVFLEALAAVPPADTSPVA